ncbi:MAG: DUF2567 domain-containing protein [Sciscionella sp.]|nr:DUF2567 domain-containing protein [Sciscionella sp.]
MEAKLLAAVWQRKPGVVVKADLLSGVAVLSFVAVFGMGLAWVWSRLAPPMQYVVLSGGQSAELPDEGWHRFDDLAIFCLISIGLGVLVGSGVWLMREHRGPVVLLAAVIGCGLGSWLAMRSGVSFAQGLYPLGAAPHVGSVVTKAPTLDSIWVIVAQPLGVALAYGVLAAYNGRHDLGRRLG